MTQEDKELLLKDLCARLPYGVMVFVKDYNEPCVVEAIYDNLDVQIKGCLCYNLAFECKPYLRPMSSMTEEEKIESLEFAWEDDYGRLASYEENIPKYIDWLNKKMFDYRGLIPKGLALEALEGMYNINYE